MGWIVLGSVLAVMLGVALIIDLRDRRRGGTKLARGGGLREARHDDVKMDSPTGDQGAYQFISPNL
jgi:hypothetical protein